MTPFSPLDSTRLSQILSRRQFLKLSGVSIVGISVLGVLLCKGETNAPLIIMEQAQGIIIADPTLCVACRRCELACTEFNDGKASPAMSRIKVNRNLNFGPKGAYAGQQGQGTWGNELVTPDFCLQCAHPVPCANACPMMPLWSNLPPMRELWMWRSALAAGCASGPVRGR